MKKDLNSLLVKGLKKKDCEELAAEANGSEAFYLALLDVIETGETTPAMKAAWVLGTAGRTENNLPTKYARRIFDLLQKSRSESVRRELLKALEGVQMKAGEEGEFIDACFKMLNAPHSDLAVRYYCIRRLMLAMKKYPDLKNELKASMEALTEYHTEPWKRYLLRTLAKLNKMK